jgi:hypothetical protein
MPHDLVAGLALGVAAGWRHGASRPIATGAGLVPGLLLIVE